MLTVFIAIVGGSVASLHYHVNWAGKVGWVIKLLVLPRQIITWRGKRTWLGMQ